MKKLIIVGISEVAKIAYEYFCHDSEHKVVAFAADKEYITDPSFNGLNVIPLDDIEATYPHSDYQLFLATNGSGLNIPRQNLYSRLKKKGYKFATYVSSKAFVWKNVTIGENCFILENNVLQPFVKIGNNVTLWSGNHIGHSSEIEDNVFISSHAVISGMCRIKHNTFVGVNAAIADNVTIEKYNLISMGAVVNKSTKENSVMIGNPAIQHKVSAKKLCKVRD